MTNTNWWDKPVRIMRLDWLSRMDKLKDVDLDKLARSVRKDWHCNVEWMIGTPGAAPGSNFEVTFQSDKFKKLPSLGEFDCLRAYLPYAKKYGIRLMAYLNLHWFSYESTKGREDWQQTMADGRYYGNVHPLYGNGTTYCINSPWRDVAGDLVVEAMKTGIDGVFLDGPLVFPECCYCPACQTKFRAKYGKAIPAQEDWGDPRWKSFVEFREDSLAEFMRDIRERVKAVNPEGVAYLNSGSWHGAGWRVAANIEKSGPFQDFNGAEAFIYLSRDELLYASASVAKYMAASRRPAVVFTHHALGSWHFNPLPAAEIQLAIAQTVACGANPWFAVFQHALESNAKAALTPVKEIQGFLEENEGYYEGTESRAQIALHYSTQTQQFYLSDIEALFPELGSGKEQSLVQDVGSGRRIEDQKKRKELCEEFVRHTFYGNFLALTRKHAAFDVVLDSDLTVERLRRYKVLILDNSACLSESQVKAVLAFVKGGGGLVTTFETGSYNERGDRRTNTLLATLLGIKDVTEAFVPSSTENYLRIKGASPMVRGFVRDQILPRPTYALKVKAGRKNAVVAAVFMAPVGQSYAVLQGETDYPAVLAAEYGKGRVVYFPALMGQFYERFKIADIEDLMAGAVNWARKSPPMLETDAPATVEIEVREQKERHRDLIHLINVTGDMQRPLREIVPVRDIHLRLRTRSPKRVYRLSDRKPLKFRVSKGVVEFVVDSLVFYDVVVVEKSVSFPFRAD